MERNTWKISTLSHYVVAYKLYCDIIIIITKKCRILALKNYMAQGISTTKKFTKKKAISAADDLCSDLI